MEQNTTTVNRHDVYINGTHFSQEQFVRLMEKFAVKAMDAAATRGSHSELGCVIEFLNDECLIYFR